ncbi:hypothetical protein [Cloacibacillus sp. An23]|uniref:hypothetical protein n=1 Tax=Cloacibacillus sp. An23 TaxID=1965591 RepID=UPI000B36C7EE|nr:hypothetical protein [Cloacibacillus sp. An23]OUO92583.1 hypothetical protein B5F39_10510 [Cloacibacillus sp. An23]
MSVKQKTIICEVRYCDYCDKELTPKNTGEFYIVAHCNGDVCYEDALGDVCKDCAEAMKRAFYGLMDKGHFAERYDDDKTKDFARIALREYVKKHAHANEQG